MEGSVWISGCSSEILVLVNWERVCAGSWYVPIFPICYIINAAPCFRTRIGNRYYFQEERLLIGERLGVGSGAWGDKDVAQELVYWTAGDPRWQSLWGTWTHCRIYFSTVPIEGWGSGVIFPPTFSCGWLRVAPRKCYLRGISGLSQAWVRWTPTTRENLQGKGHGSWDTQRGESWGNSGGAGASRDGFESQRLGYHDRLFHSQVADQKMSSVENRYLDWTHLFCLS